MKGNNRPWDKPFYDRVQQSNRAKRPILKKAQGMRLYKVTHPPKEEKHSWSPTAGGFRGHRIHAFMSSYSYSFTVEAVMTEIKWMKPKQATLLRLQGAGVREVHEDTPETKGKKTHMIGL